MDLRSQNERLCRIELLGPMRPVCGDQPQTRFATHKTEALLAYLALPPGPHPRERVINLFWPELEFPAGRNNRRATLAELRRHPPCIRRGSVLAKSYANSGLDPAAFTTDAADVERLQDQAVPADDRQTRDDLLAGCSSPVCIEKSGFKPLCPPLLSSFAL